MKFRKFVKLDMDLRIARIDPSRGGVMTGRRPELWDFRKK